MREAGAADEPELAEAAEAAPLAWGATRQAALLWGASALGFLFLSPVAPALAAGLPSCFVKQWTGIPCPTCGGTRAALALVRFDVLGALRWNPLVAAGVALLAAGGLLAGAAALAGRMPKEPVRAPVWTRAALLLALAANWAWLLVDGR
jgi:hypothetical protein